MNMNANKVIDIIKLILMALSMTIGIMLAVFVIAGNTSLAQNYLVCWLVSMGIMVLGWMF